jgi:tRNA(Ile)-lysidine synthase
MSGRLRRDSNFLDELARCEGERITGKDGRLDRKEFLGLARPLQDRILLDMISASAQPSSQMVDICWKLTQQGSGSAQLAEKTFFMVDRAALWVEQTADRVSLQQEAELLPLSVGQSQLLRVGNRQLSVKLRANEPDFENVYKLPINNLLCYDTIQDVLVLRTRRTGDRMALPRRGVSKTLKKLFCEEKILPEERELRLVLADKNGKVVWVEGIGPAAGFLPDHKSKTLLELTIFSGEAPGEDK